MKKGTKKVLVVLIALGILGAIGFAVWQGKGPQGIGDSPSGKPASASNSETLAYAFEDDTGRAFTLGVENDAITDKVVLAPRYSAATAENKVGYYISADKGSVLTDGVIAPSPGNENVADSANCMIGWSLDQLGNADYVDENTLGVYWTATTKEMKRNDVATLSIRGVDLTSNSLLFVMHAEIAYKDGAFRLVSLTNGDIAATSESANELRDNLVQAAALSVREGTLVDCEDIDFPPSSVFVEQVMAPYFPHWYDTGLTLIPKQDFEEPTYAVSIVPSTAKFDGFYTLYMTADGGVQGFDIPALLTENDLQNALKALR